MGKLKATGCLSAIAFILSIFGLGYNGYSQSVSSNSFPHSAKLDLKSGNKILVKTRYMQSPALFTNDSTAIPLSHGPHHGDLAYYLSTGVSKVLQFALMDSSEVNLNACSTLHFSTAYNKKERILYLNGEAYFVVKQSTMPFLVRTEDNELEVATGKGQFSVTTYRKEPNILIAAISGNILVSYKGSSFRLNAQHSVSICKSNRAVSFVKHDCFSDVISWTRDGLAVDKQDMYAVFRKAGRWYGKKVVFLGNLPDHTIYGELPNNLPLSSMLDAISRIFEVSAVLKDDKIIVSSNQ